MPVKRTDTWRKKRIVDSCEGALRWLGIWQTHTFTIDFANKLDSAEYNKGRDVAANVTGVYPYKRIAMTFSRDYVDHASREQIEEIAIHECLHVVLFGGVRSRMTAKKIVADTAYMQHEEAAVDLVTVWLQRKRPPKGYHAAGVANR